MTDEKKKILVVEDDIFISDIYQVKFTQEGFEVAIAVNGLEALKILDNFRPDIILLDIIMPQMDGIETLKKIKNNDKWKNIPIIMLTNISEKEKVEESEEMGVNDYLVKSQFTPSEVVGKVNALLNR
ncbi:MAG TPA: response regulator transcription factor [Candidatus Moranbacteria bacterium]|jgi:DNA-binding response OmpR family regulator|nr:response regulator transcription factor [Candidatus Moranbacteria bacterium]HRY28293.1 response regulator transcription factor [Candidatus Moranbacteria bacterium]HSA08065.1 response regulator transcription factor [Candidatus Moranbacteria bacterium]